MTSPAAAECDYCAKQHPVDFLCPPARDLLAAIRAKGDALNMPTIEFDSPVIVGDAAHYVLAGWNAAAAIVDVAGVPRGAVILTPQLLSGPVKHGLMYVGTDDQLRAFGDLVARMTDIAIRGAEKQRRAAS